MSRNASRTLTVAATVLMFALNVGTALAGTTTTPDIGTNVENLIGGWAKDWLIPVAGLMGVFIFPKRNIQEIGVLAVMVLIVGIFVYDPAGAAGIINSITGVVSK